MCFSTTKRSKPKVYVIKGYPKNNFSSEQIQAIENNPFIATTVGQNKDIPSFIVAKDNHVNLARIEMEYITAKMPEICSYKTPKSTHVICIRGNYRDTVLFLKSERIIFGPDNTKVYKLLGWQIVYHICKDLKITPKSNKIYSLHDPRIKRHVLDRSGDIVIMVLFTVALLVLVTIISRF